MNSEAILAIERDIQSRRHAKQPFDVRYLSLTTEPMLQDEELSVMTRQVKLRTSLIQAQVQTLQRSVALALSNKKTTPVLCPENPVGEDDDDDFSGELLPETDEKKLKALELFKEKDPEAISDIVAELCCSFPEVEDLKLPPSKNTETVQSMVGYLTERAESSVPTLSSENQKDLSSGNTPSLFPTPRGFYAAYLRKVQPFSLCHLEDDEEEDGEMDKQCNGESVDCMARERNSFEDGNTEREELPAETSMPFDSAQEEKEQRNGMSCEYDHASPEISQLNGRVIHDIGNDDIVDSEEDESAVNMGNMAPSISCIGSNSYQYEEQQKERYKSIQCHSNMEQNNLKQPQDGQHYHQQDSRNQHTTDFVNSLASYQSPSFNSNNVAGVHANNTDYFQRDEITGDNEADFREEATQGGIVFLEPISNSTALPTDPLVISMKKVTKTKPTPSRTSVLGTWKSFTVDDAARYSSELRAQVSENQLSQSSVSAKRRLKLKNRIDLLLPGFPSCSADAIAILRRSATTTAASAKHTPQLHSDSGDSLFYLGSLEKIEACSSRFLPSSASMIVSCLAHLHLPVSAIDKTERLDEQGGNGDSCGDNLSFGVDDQHNTEISKDSCELPSFPAPATSISIMTSIIRTSFCDFGAPSSATTLGGTAVTSSGSLSLADTPIVSVAFIRRTLLQQCVKPPSPCTIHLNKRFLGDLGLLHTSRREIVDPRLLFAALLTLANQFNRQPPEVANLEEGNRTMTLVSDNKARSMNVEFENFH